MKIYNPSSFKNQRLFRGYLAGIGTAVVLALALSIFLRLTNIYISLFYFGGAYLITMAIRKYGKGVKPSFSICGLVSVFVLILLTDLLYYSGFNLGNFSFAFKMIMYSYANLNINSLISIGIKVYSLYYGYSYARII